jgi:hypothetical protein
MGGIAHLGGSMSASKSGRPAKTQRVCHSCKEPCLPKNGDWFFLPKSVDSQVFLCKDCERMKLGKYQRAIPARATT